MFKTLDFFRSKFFGNPAYYIFWVDVTEIEVFNLIRSLDPNKANGEDCISVKILKKVNNLISPILSKLINQAFYKGVYPSTIKIKVKFCLLLNNCFMLER